MASDPTQRGWFQVSGGWERPATIKDSAAFQQSQYVFAQNAEECERLDRRAGIFATRDLPDPRP